MDSERTRCERKTLYESFSDKIDKDVIDMVYAECDQKVLDAIDCLVGMARDAPMTSEMPDARSSSPRSGDLAARGTKIYSGSLDTSSEVKSRPKPQRQKCQDDAIIDVIDCRDSHIIQKQKSPLASPAASSSQVKKMMYLMRGLPGSGKSYEARRLKGKHGVILSTDDYFERDGRYLFSPYDLREAHAWNQTRAKIATENTVSPIIIDNTNTQAWEMQPYAAMAVKNGYSVVICEPKTSWSWNVVELAKRNSHGVPEDKIAAMYERYEHGLTVDLILGSTNMKTVDTVKKSRDGKNRASKSPQKIMPSPVRSFASNLLTRPKSFTEGSGSRRKEKEQRPHGSATSGLISSQMGRASSLKTTYSSGIETAIPVDEVSPQQGSDDTMDVFDITPAPSTSAFQVLTPQQSCSSSSLLNVLEGVELDDSSNRNDGAQAHVDSACDSAQFIKDCFPDFDSTIIAMLLSANDGNVQKTCDDLLHDTIFIESDENDPISEPSLSDDLRTDAATQTDLNSHFDIGSDSLRNLDGGNKLGALQLSPECKQNQLIINMDESLCLQLKEFYGSSSEIVGWDVTDTVVQLPLDVGEQLFHALEGAIKTQKTTKQLLEQRDEIYAQQLQLYDECSQSPATSNAKTNSRPHDSRWGSTTFGSAAEYRAAEQDRKRQKMLRSFPGVDEDALLQILEANGYDLDVSLKLASASCGVSLDSIPMEVTASDHVIKPTPKSPRLSEQDQSHSLPLPNRRDASPISPRAIAVSDEEDGFQMPENPQYRDFRAEAQIHFDMRKRYLAEAAKAYGEKRGLVAQYYAAKANDQYKKMQDANDRAAAMILKRNHEMISQRDDQCIIDIHGLHVSEALIVVKHFLTSAEESGWRSVSVITGRGLHSKGGVAKLKPAVLGFLRRRNYRHTLKDEGQVLVYLD